MGGVGQISGKAAVGAGMALAAGLHHVGAAEARGRIGDGADVVRAVAVVALGGFHVTQLRDLAVVGVEVGFGDGLVAAARTGP